MNTDPRNNTTEQCAVCTRQFKRGAGMTFYPHAASNSYISLCCCCIKEFEDERGVSLDSDVIGENLFEMLQFRAAQEREVNPAGPPTTTVQWHDPITDPPDDETTVLCWHPENGDPVQPGFVLAGKWYWSTDNPALMVNRPKLWCHFPHPEHNE